MQTVGGIILGLAVLVLLVVVHELGHAIAARRNGVVVKEFGIGFPPRAWKKRLKNGILFTLNWLPLGGFVRLKGEYDSSKEKGDYGAASFWVKTKILLAGVMINWLVAAILLSVLAVTGLPKILTNQFYVSSDTTISRESVRIVSVGKDSPAEKAGITTRDTIVRFAGEPVPTVADLTGLSKANKGKIVEIIYVRDGSERSTQASLRSEGESGFFGANLSQQEQLRATWSAPIVGVVTTAQLTGETLSGLGSMVANVAKGVVLQFSGDEATRVQAKADLNEAGNSVSGPIGILGVIFPSAGQAGLTQVILLTAVISLTLAVMNTLPIPGLDGGRWFTMAAFRLLKRPLTKEREEKIQATGFTILMVLIIVITVTDITKLL